MLFCGFSTFQSRNAHKQCLNFDQFDPFSQMTSRVCYKNKKNSENLSRVGASIRAKMHRLGMGGQESNRQSLKSQEDKALFHQVKSHVLLHDRGRKAKSSNSTRYIFIGPESDHCLPLSLTP